MPERASSLLFSFPSALRSRTPALDPPRLRSLHMIRWNPVLVVCLCSCCDGWSFTSRNRRLVGRIDSLRATGRFLCSFPRFPTSIRTTSFLWEVGRYPGTIDKIAGAKKARKEEEVEKDADDGTLVSRNQGRNGGSTHICGSKMLVSCSTMLTVSLYTWTVKNCPAPLLRTVAKFSLRS